MLRELQESMRAAVWNDDPRAESLISRHELLSAHQLLGIYRGSILGGLSKALAEAYPVCRRLVGDRFFEAMVTRYVLGEPSRGSDLNTYGATLCEFIDGFEPAAGLPYLSDVARLEWAWQKAWYTEPDVPFDLAELERVPNPLRDRIRFRLSVGATLIDSSYPISHIWRVNQPDYQGAQSVDLSEGGVRLLVWRKGRDRYIEELDRAQWILLRESACGRTLADLWGLLEDAGIARGELLGEVLARGWIQGFDLGNDGYSVSLG